jgi:hypothetical protein
MAAFAIATGQLAAPVTPKQTDSNVERMRIEDESKIRELQTLLRQLVSVLHANGVAGF